MEISDAVRIDQQTAGGRSAQQQGQAGGDAIPADARFVLSVLNGDGSSNSNDRRRFARNPYVAPGELEVIGDAAPPRTAVYTRDVNRWGVGFVTQHPLPLGRDATLRIWIEGQMLMLRSCVLRCREVLPGWYEGAALLYSEEPRLERVRNG
jgi:hypothetical protein